MSHVQKTSPMARRKPGRPIGGSVATDIRQRIIDAAIGCFAREGYGKASNKIIAAEAGVTAPSLYHYFESKGALYRAALAYAIGTLVETYRTACAELPDASSIAQLCLGIEKMITLTKHQPGLMNFAGSAAGEIARHEDLDWLDTEDARAFSDFFRELLLRAKQRGELGHGINIDAAAQMLIACISGLAAMHDNPATTKDFAALLRAFELMLKGELMRT